MNSVSNAYAQLKKKFEQITKEMGQRAKDTRMSFQSYMERAQLSDRRGSEGEGVRGGHDGRDGYSDGDMHRVRNARSTHDAGNMRAVHSENDTVSQYTEPFTEHEDGSSALSSSSSLETPINADTDMHSEAMQHEVTPVADAPTKTSRSVHASEGLLARKSPLAPFSAPVHEEDVTDATDTRNQAERMHKVRDAHNVRSARTVATYAEQIKVVRTAQNALSRIYADYASLTPIDPRVKKVMIDAMDQYPANPSSLYAEGVQAKQALDRARTSVASFFGVQSREVIFTSGGTESNNLACKGVIEYCEQQIGYAQLGSLPISSRPHIIISTIEHPSIVEIALDYMQKGYHVSFVPVNEKGLINPKDIRKALTPETVLVSVMYANNEIGTVQPLKEITREIRHYKKSLGREMTDYPYMHTDASQAVLYEDMRVTGLHIDLLTVDGGKIYGPRGAGVLIKRQHVRMSHIMHGGGQELGFRPGTENMYAILGMNHALDIAHNEKEDESARLRTLSETLRESIVSRLLDVCPQISVNGDIDARLPNNVNICFPGLDAEFLVIRLDSLGVQLSSVTSCRASSEDSSSYVIEALGKSNCAQSSLRISLGRHTSALDVAHIVERVVQVVREQYLATA
jgi:cysteine desulfurase